MKKKRKFVDIFPVLNPKMQYQTLNYLIFLSSLCWKAESINENPVAKTDIGNCELQKLCEILFHSRNNCLGSTIKRTLNKTKNRPLPKTLMYGMIISIEGPGIPTEQFLKKAVNLYTTKKTYKISLNKKYQQLII